MIVTWELLTQIKEAIEKIEYGTIKITVNEKGAYTEVSVEEKKRINKNETGYHKG